MLELAYSGRMPPSRKDVPKPLPVDAYVKTVRCSRCGEWVYAAPKLVDAPLMTACRCWRRVESASGVSDAKEKTTEETVGG